MEKVLIKSHLGVYPVLIEEGLIDNFWNALKEIGFDDQQKNFIIVCDQDTRFLADKIATQLELDPHRVVSVVPGEATKTIDIAQQLWQRFLHFQGGRSTVVIAIGGGVVGDLAGFAAGTFMRGVPLIHVPTTLTAQVDSSIGGKVGVNMPVGKNLIGLFYPPVGVVIDPCALSTLPAIQFRSGLSEIVKLALLFSPQLYHKILELTSLKVGKELNNIILEAINLKGHIVGEDEFEKTDRRLLLNFGHTIGHAIECGADFHGITHGQAIAIGMLAEIKLISTLDRWRGPALDSLRSDFEKIGILAAMPAHFDSKRALYSISKDKKGSSGTIKLGLPRSIGETQVLELPQAQVLDLCENLGLLT